ncbi:uromodulin-like [Mizuhopecten yessoensis]|uniref:uromodulin-like n=1 Tax=Mizuhopecten yessoensis TaxID=6573 RepID=UPI000B458437|nr:uromodulin-like [Mizuhopecten yessoensis]
MIPVITFVVFYCFTAFLLSTADADPCLASNHVTIDDVWRSTINMVTDGSYRCDSVIELAWYRLSSLGNIATSYPDLNSCGTSYPIWMDDVLPSTGTTKTVKMCMRSLFTSCHKTWSIQLKNCQSFYVYELIPTSLCPSAYCFDALPAVLTTTTTASYISDNTTYGSPSIQADIPQAGITLGALLGALIVMILVVAVHVTVMIVCYKITTKNRNHADDQVDPHHEVPMQAGIKVEGLPA